MEFIVKNRFDLIYLKGILRILFKNYFIFIVSVETSVFCFKYDLMGIPFFF